MKTHGFMVAVDLAEDDRAFELKQEMIYLLSKTGENVDVEYLGEIEQFEDEGGTVVE